MDFAAQLAKLQRSAEAARRRPAADHRHSNDRDGDRPRQRQRRHESSSASPPPSGRGVSSATTTTTPSNIGSSSTSNGRKTSAPFQILQRAGYRIDPATTIPSEEPSSKPNQVVRHICLLAVTIDELPYENLWEQWANTPSSTTSAEGDNSATRTIVSLVCHAKYSHKVQSDFMKRRLLQEPPRVGRGNQWAPPEFRSHRPEWGSIEILRAMLDILHDGLQIGGAVEEAIKTDERYHPKRYLITPTTPESDATATNAASEANTSSSSSTMNNIPPADMFVFISETCIPIQPLSHWIRHLDATRSWVNARHRGTPGTPRNKYELDQFANIRLVPDVCRYKADQWMALCRSHAIRIRQIDNHLPERDRLWRRAFCHVNASDEMYFPTALAILQLLKPEDDDNRTNNNEEHQQHESSSTPLSSTGAQSAWTVTPTTTPSRVSVVAPVEKRPVTYTDWSQGMKNPTTFTHQDLRAVVERARVQGCLVARKFTGEIPMADWERLCNTNNE